MDQKINKPAAQVNSGGAAGGNAVAPNLQSGPRMPAIKPETFELVNYLDACLAKAPLTREDHMKVTNAMQRLLLLLEDNERLIANLQRELLAELSKEKK